MAGPRTGCARRFTDAGGRRVRYVEWSSFRSTELQIRPTKEILSQAHSQTQNTFSVLEGEIRVVLRDPKEEMRLRSADIDAECFARCDRGAD